MVRFKNRYLVVLVTWPDGAPDGLSEQIILQAVRNALQASFGDLALGLALSTLTVKYYNTYSHVAVIRVPRDMLDKALQSMKEIRSLQLRRVLLDVKTIAGTIRTCKEAALALDQSILQVKLQRLSADHQAVAQSQQDKLKAMDA